MSPRPIVLIFLVGILAILIALEAGVIYSIIFLAALLLLRSAFLYLIWDYVAPIPPAPLGAIKVACIGDSITYGSKLRYRAQNCYPSQLEALLGEGYAVRNFGVNGRSLQKSGDRPYWKHRNFRRSGDFEPDMVIIMLGTNDSKIKNWKNSGEYLADYREMVRYYRQLPSHPSIFVMTPPTAHGVGGKGSINYTINNEAMDEMSSVLKGLAMEEGLTVIDIRTATADHPEYFPVDGVHTNEEGAIFIARLVYRALTGKPGRSGSPDKLGS